MFNALNGIDEVNQYQRRGSYEERGALNQKATREAKGKWTVGQHRTTGKDHGEVARTNARFSVQIAKVKEAEIAEERMRKEKIEKEKENSEAERKKMERRKEVRDEQIRREEKVRKEKDDEERKGKSTEGKDNTGDKEGITANDGDAEMGQDEEEKESNRDTNMVIREDEIDKGSIKGVLKEVGFIQNQKQAKPPEFVHRRKAIKDLVRNYGRNKNTPYEGSKRGCDIHNGSRTGEEHSITSGVDCKGNQDSHKAKMVSNKGEESSGGVNEIEEINGGGSCDDQGNNC